MALESVRVCEIASASTLLWRRETCATLANGEKSETTYVLIYSACFPNGCFAGFEGSHIEQETKKRLNWEVLHWNLIYSKFNFLSNYINFLSKYFSHTLVYLFITITLQINTFNLSLNISFRVNIGPLVQYEIMNSFIFQNTTNIVRYWHHANNRISLNPINKQNISPTNRRLPS